MRVVRCSSRACKWSSSDDTARDTLPVLQFMWSATALKLPDSTTREKMRMLKILSMEPFTSCCLIRFLGCGR
ncbi:hypothetical protein PSAB6_60265 [Paraburkholderia sabiae]|nr:hypothetical protein PSAB6_60265 [Paraburkholderia sabiae]